MAYPRITDFYKTIPDFTIVDWGRG